MVSVSALAPLSSALFGLIKVLDSDSVKNFFKTDKEFIDKLKLELLTAEAVLSDAEEKQITNPKVKEWLNELKYAAYDADDLLDVATTDALKRKMEGRVKGKVMAAVNVVVERSSPIIPSYTSVRDRLKNITERLENLAKRRDLLNLKGSARVKPPPRRQTTSLLDESEVFGRDKDKEKLMEFLLGGTVQESEIPVIAIVGIPGVGKTTLAQLLYNDSRVMKHFRKFRAWVHVSEELDVFKVTRTIFESVVSQNCHVTDLNVLQVTLKATLSGKRFLLVLDDIWNENLFDWDLLSAPLKAGECGSRIIVTTRNQGVASIMRAIATHHLPQLSNECCQKLFEKYAFGISNPDDHPNLKEIGHDIAIKCQGLPLAAKTLGSLLHSESETKQWRRILHSKIWDLPNDKNGILPALRLSYDHLHPHLKQCFAYCSVFSKGYEFKKEKLIFLWMAEGFLQQPKGEESMEEIGDKYFLELLSRSFVQASNRNKQHFVMHDLVNDLAQFASGEFCCKFEDGKPQGILEKARHFAWLVNEFDSLDKFEVKSMRTFLLLGSSNTRPCHGSGRIFSQEMLPKLKSLRVLSLCGLDINKLPDLHELIHLRYLDLSNSSISELPSTTCSLYNMQTLLLSSCYSLTGLPAEIGKLINLRHLDMSGSTSITKLPPNFGKLKNLQMLTDFLVGEDDQSSKISELGELPCLRGRLSISRLENVHNVQQASKANLKSKSYLCELVFRWTTTNTRTDYALSVLESLEPHTDLEKLTIENYSGRTFPNWLGVVKFSNMVILHLTNCSFCESLPSLGRLSSLQELYISKMNRLESATFGSDEDGKSGNLPFRSLKILSFKGMISWKSLTCHLPFPSLQELRIQNCGELIGELPKRTYLPCLQNLKLFDCPKLTSTNSDLKILGERLRGLTSLEKLHITSSSISTLSNLKLLGEGLHGPTSLKELEIDSCENLQLMQAEGLLPSLQSLVITDCKELEEFGLYRMESPTCYETTNGCGEEKEFRKSPLLNTLTSLCINIKSREQCGLHGMESLIDFEITGDCDEVRSFPEEGLPSRISSITDLENLLQHLTSLKSLEIKCSMTLKSIL
ncbi:putative disease resistance RPP13-like protein 1 [Castanea sativa]|uniref:putative disease resistance RPP13-like protein 1 n=1 Tax=Castanea sativa TaxID=21020 RepID=UPI003F653A21